MEISLLAQKLVKNENKITPQTIEPVGKQNFKQILSEVAVKSSQDKTPSFENSVIKSFETFNNSWHQANSKIDQQIKKLNPEFQGLVKVQRSVQQVDLQTQIFTKVGEALLNTLRRVEQMGGN